ncbi:MAG: flagellar basal body P-ring formation protein FlgA [Candidatus Zixiibacteriota bacterium]|nr:MAG: flagellar basal body P-ring formation protein FlgA [candidate division Zixibacteria bacterium]
MGYFKKLLMAVLLLAISCSAVFADEHCDQLIVAQIMSEFGLDEQWYDIEILSNRLDVVEIGEYDVTVRPLTQKDPVGLYSIVANLSKQGETVATGQVRMRIRKFAEVVVAGDRIRRSEELDPARFSLERKEVTNLVEQPVVSLAELAGFRAKRNLKKGTIVTSGALEAIPDLERGHETLIVYNDGVCRITAPGVALQSGLSGDYIKVKNKATNKIILAKIIDDGAVAVDP